MWQVWSKLHVEAVEWVRSGESVILNLGNATLCFNGCFAQVQMKNLCAYRIVGCPHFRDYSVQLLMECKSL